MMVEIGLALVLISLNVTIRARQPAKPARTINKTELQNGFISLLFLLDHARGQHSAIAIVMQLEREDQDVPVPAAFLLGQVRQAAEAAVHISFTRVGHGADNVFPLGAKLGKFFKTVLAGEPCALAFI